LDGGVSRLGITETRAAWDAALAQAAPGFIEGVLKEVSDLQNEFEFVNELTGSERDLRQRDLEALRNSAPVSPPSLTNSPPNRKINSVAMACPSPRCFRSRSPF
jgi:hypothetical protein